jgi:predicted permease
MAEGRRFELLTACTVPVFKTGALDRSATPPQRSQHTVRNGEAQGPNRLVRNALHCITVSMLAGLVPVFLLLGLGVLARRFGLLDEPSATGLNRLVVYFALPALFIAKVGTSPLESALSPRLMFVTVIVAAAATVLGLWYARAAHLLPSQRGALAQGAMRGNIVYFTFPLILTLYGDDGLRLAAVSSTVLIPVMNLLAVGALELYRPAGVRDRHIVVRVLANPIVLGALLSLALAVVHWRPWGWLALTLNALADLAFPGALLALGAQLEVVQWRRMWRPLGVAAAIKLVLMPLGGWWVLKLLGATPLETAVGVLMLAAPTAVASHSVAAELGGDVEFSSSCVLVTTVLSVLTYVGWVLVLPR